MTCKCGSDRIVSINGKVSDMCFTTQGAAKYEGGVVSGLGIGSGDYITFKFCLECGHIQNWKPAKDLKQILEDEYD